MPIRVELKIIQMKVTFLNQLEVMTYNHYLHQTKQMIEWTLIKYLNENPNEKNYFLNMPKPFLEEIDDEI